MKRYTPIQAAVLLLTLICLRVRQAVRCNWQWLRYQRPSEPQTTRSRPWWCLAVVGLSQSDGLAHTHTDVVPSRCVRHTRPRRQRQPTSTHVDINTYCNVLSHATTVLWEWSSGHWYMAEWAILQPSSRLFHTLPPARDLATVTRLRAASKFPRIPTCTKNTSHSFPLLSLVTRLHRP